MNTLKIDIINPKAVKLLKDLADLNLITIHSESKNKFQDVLNKLRLKSATVPNFDEVTKEVEIVRANRYAE